MGIDTVDSDHRIDNGRMRKYRVELPRETLKTYHLGAILLTVASLFFLHDVFVPMAGVWGAENYPVKPINFIVPIEAGADADVLARPLAQKVSKLLGKPLMVVNKPGAASSIGIREIYNAKPDGYTIGIAWAVLIIDKLQGILPIDQNDFTILGTYATYTPIIIGATKTQRPFTTIQEMTAFAKAHPGDVSIATTAVGGSFWVAAQAFQAASGLQFNIIPQPGGGAFSVAQVAGGHTDLAVLALGSAKSHINSGNVRFLANFGSKRAIGYENVPSLNNCGAA